MLDLTLFDRIKDYDVLVTGDDIIDEYCYVSPLGKNPKESIIVTEYRDKETFKGGTWAAAKHLESFCKSVRVITGENTVVKRRFVDDVYFRKLFEIHEYKNSGIRKQAVYQDYDLVIVTDFGHGFINNGMIEEFNKARFLAVNAQSNSSNYGFNLVSKYPRADYVVVDEPEARLAAHDREGKIEDIILKLGFSKIIVTHGSHGAVGYDGSFFREKAHTSKVVDTMGAGDAFLSITAPLAKAGASMKELIHIGNAAGALKCGIVGHRKSVDKDLLLAYLNAAG